MFDRLAVRLLIAVLAAASLAASSAGSTTVATDPCGVGSEDADVGVMPWLDLCELSMTTVSAGGGPTTLEVRLGVESTERLAPSTLSVRWDVGDCAIRLVYGDATPDHDAVSTISSECEGDEPGPYECTVTGPEPLDYGAGLCIRGHATADVPVPVVEGTEYVWTVTFDGAVADVVGAHQPGTVLEGAAASGSIRVERSGAGKVLRGCSYGECSEYGSDAMRSTVSYTVG